MLVVAFSVRRPLSLRDTESLRKGKTRSAMQHAVDGDSNDSEILKGKLGAGGVLFSQSTNQFFQHLWANRRFEKDNRCEMIRRGYLFLKP